jgi:hypothetical protein
MANLEKTPETEHLMPCGRRAQTTPLMQPGGALISTYKSPEALSNRFDHGLLRVYVAWRGVER